MRTDHGTRVPATLCVAAAVFVLAFFCSRQLFGGEAPVSAAAPLTASERMRLPDNTMVKLKSGQTAWLGTLRVEHRARLDRFSRATGLGRLVGGKLVMHPVNSAQISPAVTAKAGSPAAPSGKGAVPIRGTMQAGSNISQPPSLVPFTIPTTSSGPTPRDYLDFCKAANPSVCIYLPPNASMEGGATWAVDIDYLITDNSVCDYDGGVLATDITACMFYYPYVQATNFKPTGPLTTAASCDPPFRYVVDPRGAIQASYPSVPGKRDIRYVYTGGTPATCVIQVWISR